MTDPKFVTTSVQAVLFDAYGTLAYIAQIRRPYARLLRELRLAGVGIPDRLGELVMTERVTLADLAARFGGAASSRSDLEADLALELSSIQLFPEVLTTLKALKARGLKLGVCSNLALPYAAPLLELLPPLDAYLWSFEVGAIKPDPAIFQAACQELACAPEQVLMVGDSFPADVAGARAAGLQAAWLRRDGPAGDLGSLEELLAILNGEKD